MRVRAGTRLAALIAKRVIRCINVFPRVSKLCKSYELWIFNAPSFGTLACNAMYFDVSTDCFRVTVSLAAGRGVSGPRRLARSNAGSLAGVCVYEFAVLFLLKPDLVQ